MKTPRLHLAGVLALGALLGLGGATLLRAQDKPDDQPSKDSAALDAAAAMHGDEKITADIAEKFAKFAGSEANASALITGLRTAGKLTLTDAAGVATTLKPATEAMGYGNIMLALSLAREALAKEGVKHPTPAQLQAALNGGTVTLGTDPKARIAQMPGVLALRAQGLGWGQIAQQLDVKLGRATSELRAEARHVEKTMKPEKLEPTGRPSVAGGPGTAGGAERPERAERFERPNRGPAGR